MNSENELSEETMQLRISALSQLIVNTLAVQRKWGCVVSNDLIKWLAEKGEHKTLAINFGHIFYAFVSKIDNITHLCIMQKGVI